MKKDIHFEEVKDVAVAVVKETAEGADLWNVYLINLKKIPLKNVLINSSGYGTEKKENVKTSTLRFFFEEIPAESFVVVEPIMPEVFSLNNEYWLSFYIGEEIQDKKYIFLAESIIEKNLVKIPLVNLKGVLIK
ncbi:MAG: hypothetical protein IAF38_08250 [Bacteroidia bacterium]|nr:hypothetical protein [Bacteroidia bacterium]